MSKKSLNVSLDNKLENNKDILKVYLPFEKKLKIIGKKLITIAISGGPDSLALAALSKFYSKENKTRFFYVLVDHGLRKNSSIEAIKVKKILKKIKIKLFILTNKVKISSNIQSNARDIRYKMLSEFCKKKNIRAILTAHNLEDQVETFFIRLSRGSGLNGLSAMQNSTKIDKNLRLYRPLLDTKKRELIMIAKKVFGEFIRDPSNNNLKFLRTKIRKLKKPLINSGITYDQIIKSINNLASSKATLESFMAKKSKEMIKIKKKNQVYIDLKKLNNSKDEVKIRVINDAMKKLKKNYYNSRSKKVLNLTKNFKDKHFKKATLGGCIFEREQEQLSIKNEKKR